MITVIYSTHKNKDYNDKFKSHLEKSIDVKKFQILEYENLNEFSLSEIYNKGISESIYDIIVCCHNDIKLEQGWGKKLLRDFEENPEYGIIGKAGSCYFPESGIYWEKMNETMVGQVYHHPDGQKKWLSSYSGKFPFIIPVVTVDGLFISFKKSKIKHNFDEEIGKFHFYDHPFSISNYLSGVKIGVTTSFEITHESVGQPNEEFFISKNKFLEKYSNKLPIDLKPNHVFFTKPKFDIKKNGNKVAIVIITKSKLNLLFDCVNSYYENCDSDLFDIFIADTGSSEEEIEKINEFIKHKTNIKLIQYDYYQFSKNNNDVVKNHLLSHHEFILFSNNDVKLLNDVVSGMLKTFKENRNTGTVGCRLHFEDNTIQHCGIIAGVDQNNFLHVSHHSLRSYYKYNNSLSEVIGSTGALLMIRKNVFEKIGGFNENYLECFEDVELNLECIRLGLKNFMDGRLAAYHYESQTRNDNLKKIEGLRRDYTNNLYPYYLKNKEKIKKFLIKI